MNKKPAVDKIGQAITVGSYIVYGHAMGRCAGLRIGKVLDIKYVEDNNYGQDKKAVASPHYTVWGVDDDWSHHPAKLCMTRGKLAFGDTRIVVLSRDQVPQRYRDLLEPVTMETKGTTWRKQYEQERSLLASGPGSDPSSIPPSQ